MRHIRAGKDKDLFISGGGDNSIGQYAALFRCGISKEDWYDHTVFAQDLEERDLNLYGMILRVYGSICLDAFVKGLHFFDHLPVNRDFAQRRLKIINRACKGDSGTIRTVADDHDGIKIYSGQLF